MAAKDASFPSGRVKEMVNSKKLFGIRIKSLRENKEWTQEVLAERMDISAHYISSIERGKENPTFDMLMKFSDALKVDMWELFDFEHEASPRELREMLKRFVSDIDEEKLKDAVRVLRTMVR
ncbi:MAG: helix-turn-helix transcriptional regulator [Deltaproteobacteria bacterium]|nr:helix-turn-helix transcriptional regulator [Deltaproteobacteria bacterium]